SNSAVLPEVNMPGMTGLETLKSIRQFDPTITVLIITAHGNIRDAVEAMRDGAFNYIEKPVQQADSEELVDKATTARSLLTETGLSSPKMKLENSAGPASDNNDEFIGQSSRMRSVFEIIQRVGLVNTSVLIRG